MSSLYWLLSHEALQVRVMRAIREARTPLTAKAPAPAARDVLAIDGRTATITVQGVLTPTPDKDAAWFDEPNTLYPDLQAALQSALANKSVGKIVWHIDSPGGSVDGLFALLDDIADARGKKPMSVFANNAHSAAYGIAAAVGKITATSRMSSFGSVGVATSGFISGGICGTVVDIASTDAPEKRPDLATAEGKAVVQRYLDQIAGEFMGAIAKGRGVDFETVRTGYGRGSSMLAGPALDAGLIDSVVARESVGARLDSLRPSAYARETMAEPNAKPDEQEPAVQAAPPPAAEAPAATAVASADAALSTEERAELQAFRAEKAERDAAERRSLVTELVALNAETPATAWANGAPVARLAAEPLPELRARVAALRSVPRATPGHSAPVPGAGPVGEEALTDFERADAAKIKDPEARARFVAKRLARKQKA